MPISVGGIVSGIDTDSMISQLVAAARAPQAVMERQAAQLGDTRDAYSTLKSRLTTLQTAMEDLSSIEDFRAVSSSSTDSAVTVTTESDAVVGTFSVQVNQLAQSEMKVSDGYASRTADGTFNTGTLTIDYGGESYEIEIDADNSSLNDVVALINAEVEGVTAYVMDTGDATTPYRLVLTGEDTGADYAITLDTSALAGTAPNFTTVTSAQDAEATVNGITITSSTNEITGAIQGVTFDLSDVTTSAATVRVQSDLEAMTTKVQTFVSAYNNVVGYIDAQRAYNPDENIRGAFVGESQTRSVLQTMQQAFSSSYSANTVFPNLSALGISTTQSGELEFDTTTFEEAVDANLDAVIDLFADEENGFTAGFLTRLDSLIDDEDGIVSGRIDSLDDRIEAFSERIVRFDERMEQLEDRLRGQFTAMEIAMARFQQAEQALTALMPTTSSSSNSSSSS